MKTTAEERLADLGAAVPLLLFPNKGIDLHKWAVIACDQGTQDRPYWEQARSIAGEAPSALNLIYPEVYLEEPGREKRIADIHHSMNCYLKDDIFASPEKALVYIERDTPYNQKRKGLLVALDLEAYDWKAAIHNPPMIRPTEGTVPERLPPRMEIRRGAPLETPHILVLIDDEENFLFPALSERANNQAAPFYNTELMLGGGCVRGWKLDKEDDWNVFAEGLEKLAKRAEEKYGIRRQEQNGAQPFPFLYAVGDGNHSLAAAKGVWEEYKAAHQNDAEIMNHPSRWAMAELVNLYDPALCFEPIHRLLMGANSVVVQQALAQLPGFRRCKPDSPQELASLVQDEQCGLLRLGLVSREQSAGRANLSCLLIEADPAPLAVDVIQPLLDKLIEEEKGKVIMDYIHGREELFRLAGSSENLHTTGILFPPFHKQGLFETIAKRGPLPRKSFSLGESCEKRYYLECRELFGTF